MPVTARAFGFRNTIFTCVLLSAMALIGVRPGNVAAADAELAAFPSLGGPAISADAKAGFTQLYLGNLDESQKLFQKAADANPQDSTALYGLAIHAIGHCELQRGMELLCKTAKAGAATSSPWTELYLAEMEGKRAAMVRWNNR